MNPLTNLDVKAPAVAQGVRVARIPKASRLPSSCVAFIMTHCNSHNLRVTMPGFAISVNRGKPIRRLGKLLFGGRGGTPPLL